jgi:argininosuccinate lyase
VEDVNDAVAKGVPFRDAYREVGLKVHRGEYEHDGRELHHTHEGSIGNLCLDQIKARFERNKFDYEPAIRAERELMR